MKKHYYDAMAMVRKFGTPDYFVTFTMDPNCPDIKNNLHPNEKYVDRPDICVRVYWARFQAFLDDLLKNHVLGVVKAYVSVTEFQKRGLPHAHLLLWMEEKDKIKSIDQLDEVIWAHLPDPNDDKELYDLVSNLMIHTCSYRCRVKNPDECSKGYPKNFQIQSVIQDNGYPYLKRLKNGVIFRKYGKQYDNRHVVPYNPYLLKKYRCHINIEMVSSVDCVKYLFKYIFKGNDSAIVNIDSRVEEKSNENDEENEHEVNFETLDDLQKIKPFDYDEFKNYLCKIQYYKF